MILNSLNINEEFFLEEVRDEYLITTKQKKIWAVQLDLLHKLLEVCEKHDIKIYAFAGTLLGAVRHGGYIPWDDDIDVCISADDFLKLEKLADREFKEPYFFQTALTDRKYFFGYGRLRNSSTTGIISWNKSPEYNNGIFIDIFVLNGLALDDDGIKKQIRKRDFYHKLLNAYYMPYEKTGVKKVMIKCLSKILRTTVKYEWLVDRYRDVMSEYDEIAERFTFLTHDWDFIHRYLCFRDGLEPHIMMPFEMLEIPVPYQYKRTLEHTYGDYMEFPPVEQRGIWHEDQIIFDPDVPFKEFMINGVD